MQPYFFPYIGYYQLTYEVEKFVFLDDVNFIKQGYINSNSILMNGRQYIFTIPVLKISQNRAIYEHSYSENFSKFIKTLELNYRKARYFSAVMPLIERVVLDKENNVARKNANSIVSVFDYLGLRRDFLFSSDVKGCADLRGQDRILTLCETLGIDRYRNAIGGQSLYSKEAFNERWMELKFIQSEINPYPQRGCDFVSHLSIIDVMMHCDKSTILKQLADYSLV